MSEQTKDTKEVETTPPTDPATPVHVNTDPTPPVVTVSDPHAEPVDEPEVQQPNQGGDPAGDTPPEKDGEDPTPEPVELVDADEAQQVAEMVAEAGLKPAELRQVMEANGGKVPLKALRSLIDKHGEALATRLVGELNGMYTAGEQKKTDATNSVYTAVEAQFEGAEVGTGKQHFEEASAWARENMSEADRGVINELLKSPTEAIRNMAVEKLAGAYQQSDKYEQGATLEQGDGLARTVVSALSKRDYVDQYDALMRKGYSPSSPEAKALDNSRLRGKQKGL